MMPLSPLQRPARKAIWGPRGILVIAILSVVGVVSPVRAGSSDPRQPGNSQGVQARVSNTQPAPERLDDQFGSVVLVAVPALAVVPMPALLVVLVFDKQPVPVERKASARGPKLKAADLPVSATATRANTNTAPPADGARLVK